MQKLIKALVWIMVSICLSTETFAQTSSSADYSAQTATATQDLQTLFQQWKSTTQSHTVTSLMTYMQVQGAKQTLPTGWNKQRAMLVLPHGGVVFSTFIPSDGNFLGLWVDVNDGAAPNQMGKDRQVINLK